MELGLFVEDNYKHPTDYELFAIMHIEGTKLEDCQFRAIVKKKEKADAYQWYEFAEETAYKITTEKALTEYNPQYLYYRPSEKKL